VVSAASAERKKKEKSTMRAFHLAWAPCVLLTLSGCVAGAVEAPEESTGQTSSDLALPPIVDRVPVTPFKPHFATGGLITFDDVATGTVVSTQYQSVVTFSAVTTNSQGNLVTLPESVYALGDMEAAAATPCNSVVIIPFTPACPPTGNDVTIVQPPAILPAFSGTSGGLMATFVSPKTSVSITTRPWLAPEWLGSVTNEPFLEAFDPNGNFLGQALYPYAYGDASWGTWQTLTVSAPAGSTIGSVVFATQAYQSSVTVYAEFDNLLYFPQ
jgi:hypothetical protein